MTGRTGAVAGRRALRPFPEHRSGAGRAFQSHEQPTNGRRFCLAVAVVLGARGATYGGAVCARAYAARPSRVGTSGARGSGRAGRLRAADERDQSFARVSRKQIRRAVVSRDTTRPLVAAIRLPDGARAGLGRQQPDARRGKNWTPSPKRGRGLWLVEGGQQGLGSIPAGARKRKSGMGRNSQAMTSSSITKLVIVIVVITATATRIRHRLSRQPPGPNPALARTTPKPALIPCGHRETTQNDPPDGDGVAPGGAIGSPGATSQQEPSLFQAPAAPPGTSS